MPARTKRAAFAAENIRYLAVGVKNLGFGGGGDFACGMAW